MDKPRVSEQDLGAIVRSADEWPSETQTLADRLALDLLDARRRIAELEKDAEQWDASLTVSQSDTAVIISIGIGTLAEAFNQNPDNSRWNAVARVYEQVWKVCDPKEFAKNICQEMQKESDGGDTPLSEFFDCMAQSAADAGSLGVTDDLIAAQRQKEGER